MDKPEHTTTTDSHTERDHRIPTAWTVTMTTSEIIVQEEEDEHNHNDKSPQMQQQQQSSSSSSSGAETDDHDPSSSLVQVSKQLQEVSLTEGTAEEPSTSMTASTTETPPGRCHSNKNKRTILCDAGYGLPRERRPRQEKINAICGQLSNFIKWQLSKAAPSTTSVADKPNDVELANICIVGYEDDDTMEALHKRLLEHLDMTVLPDHVTFSTAQLGGEHESTTVRPSTATFSQEDTVVYLSPDADEALDPSSRPPSTVVVGLLIDRRVQVDRSKHRAETVNIISKRWPLQECFSNIHDREPLNVDCIMEGIQQWWWNCDDINVNNDDDEDDNDNDDGEDCSDLDTDKKNQLLLREAFIQATSQALDHHAERHPSRSLHRMTV